MTTDSATRRGELAAALILLVSVVAQLWEIDYGTHVNDVPYVAQYRPTQDVAAGSALTRNLVVGTGAADREQPDLWATRFKLYSVEADEIVNILALARINSHRMSPDPGFYTYGGAWIYPLGAWYFVLTKAGVVDIRDLQGLLAEPQRMDKVWIFGRVFTLLSFTLSAGLLFFSLRRLTSIGVALLLLGIYVFCPGSVLFSQIMKPHWYGLLWVNLALYALVRAYQEKRHSLGLEALLGVALGLAVGSAVTFGMFAVGAWIALVVLVRRGGAAPLALVRTPAFAALSFVATNPYYFLNWSGMSAERAALKTWFSPELSLSVLGAFIDNSMFTNLGIALTLVLLLTLLVRAVRTHSAEERLFAVGLLFALVFGAVMTSSMRTWHSNIRYVSYALPSGLIFLASWNWSRRLALLGVTLAATLAQSVPLKVAYFDEDDPARSTRLAAAAWVDKNIPAGEVLCVGSPGPAPYDVPPFRHNQYLLRKTGCRWRILVERETDATVPAPQGELLRRFRPRFSPEKFPLVFGHINPQISVYKVTEPASAAVH